MKLLKIIIPKEITSIQGMIREIITKYPKADSDSIYATLYKHGYKPAYSSIVSASSRARKEMALQRMVGAR